MAEFTKGEWKAWFDKKLCVKDVSGRTLAVLIDGTYEEKEANARLIAAAPKLYEVLKGVLELTKGYSEMPKDMISEAVNKALALAKGKKD